MEGLVVFLIIFYVAVIAVMAVSMWLVFEKAGQPGWAALIPVYNLIIFMRIIEKPWWWILLWMIPYAQLIWIIWGWNLLARKFGKTESFTVGLILLPFIFVPMLAFGSAKYEGAVEGTTAGTTAPAEGQLTSNDTVDKVLLAVIIFMFAAAFLRFVLQIAHVNTFGPVTRYFEYILGFIGAFVPIVLGLVVKNKSTKMVCIILGGLYAVFVIVGIVTMMRHMMMYNP